MRRNVIVLGASAGGVEALRTVAGSLPANLPATVLVVLHVPSYGGSVLPAILDRAGPLTARHPDSGELLRPGEILVAPPDRHLTVHDGRVVLTRGPKENGHRPAVDVLFRSAARSADSRVIAAVLSGVLDDGTAGLAAVSAQGGVTIVQDPEDAVYPGMPLHALEHVPTDYVVPVDKLGDLLSRLVDEDIPERHIAPAALLNLEADLAMMDDDALNEPDRPGRPSGFSCPDCNGVLWEIRDGDLVRYRCRVGHAWSPESLFGEQAQQLDSALWMALRGLEEKAALARTLGNRAKERNNPHTAKRFAEQADEAGRAASLIRRMLEAHVGTQDEPQTGTE